MYWYLTPCIFLFLVMTGCNRTPNDVWRDSKSAARHMGRGVSTLGGKHGESRQVRSGEEFDGVASRPKAGNDDFIALEDESGQPLMVSDKIPQSKESPGERGSSIPGIDGFQDPSQDPRTASIFKNIHFDYNSSLVKSDVDLDTLQKIANYMHTRPNVYIFIEGHCDKRGPAAYNYALGANRSNAARNVLVKDGVDPDHVFTVSYGKDRLLAEGETEEIHTKNRRCQFKIFVK